MRTGEELTTSGIDIIGSVPWGSHFCQFYQAAEDLLDILLPYFRAGLENDEFCMWVTAQPVSETDAERAMREVVPDLDRYLDSGQLEIIPHSEWYLKGGAFNSERVLAGWVDKLNGALVRGYNGLRLTGNTFWLEKRDWRGFSDYERAVDNVIGRYRMLALCTYQADRCGVSEVADVISNHQFALIKRHGQWEIIESAERRRAEEERGRLLREIDAQRRLFQTVVDHVPAGIAVLSGPDFVFELANPSYQAIAPGRTTQGRTVAEVWPEIADQVLPVLRRVVETGEPYRATDAPFRIQPAVGAPPEERYFTFSYIPLHISDRDTSVLLVLAMETTQQVLARNKVERLVAELERRAAELDAANKELEAFSFSVSHDLRAPLRGIDGFSAMLLENYADRLDERGKGCLQFLRQGSRQMAQLIDDLLSLSRATRAELHRQQVDLSALANAIAVELRQTQPERLAEFLVAPGLVADGDVRLLRVVLENLLGNAWKFTGRHATARIEFGTVEQQGERVYFVRDDGAGFEMAYAGKLFGAFRRLHGEKEFPGNGIGLATVQRIIRRHGGRVWAEGKVEQGATFYFTL
ncbi:MAG: MEDS domain-containing protein [Chloroflexi bacterium]|nr:MEDS domain-containing protein [Chloroflexota bacterium]